MVCETWKEAEREEVLLGAQAITGEGARSLIESVSSMQPRESITRGGRSAQYLTSKLKSALWPHKCVVRSMCFFFLILFSDIMAKKTTFYKCITIQ